MQNKINKLQNKKATYQRELISGFINLNDGKCLVSQAIAQLH
jgi:hypothetical protein